MGCLVFLKVRSGRRVENGLQGDEGVRVFPQHGGGGVVPVVRALAREHTLTLAAEGIRTRAFCPYLTLCHPPLPTSINAALSQF